MLIFSCDQFKLNIILTWFDYQISWRNLFILLRAHLSYGFPHIYIVFLITEQVILQTIDREWFDSGYYVQYNSIKIAVFTVVIPIISIFWREL